MSQRSSAVNLQRLHSSCGFMQIHKKKENLRRKRSILEKKQGEKKLKKNSKRRVELSPDGNSYVPSLTERSKQARTTRNKPCGAEGHRRIALTVRSALRLIGVAELEVSYNRFLSGEFSSFRDRKYVHFKANPTNMQSGYLDTNLQLISYQECLPRSLTSPC